MYNEFADKTSSQVVHCNIDRYFPIPIMQYVLGDSLHIKIAIQIFYSWDCIILQWTGYPLFECKWTPKMNCIMGFVKMTKFFLDSIITSRNNKLTKWPAYNTFSVFHFSYSNRCYLNQKSLIECKETKLIRLDTIVCVLRLSCQARGRKHWMNCW